MGGSGSKAKKSGEKSGYPTQSGGGYPTQSEKPAKQPQQYAPPPQQYAQPQQYAPQAPYAPPQQGYPGQAPQHPPPYAPPGQYPQPAYPQAAQPAPGAPYGAPPPNVHYQNGVQYAPMPNQFQPGQTVIVPGG